MLAAVTACTAGSPGTVAGHAVAGASNTSPRPSGSSGVSTLKCPTTPVSGPSHTLTLPPSIDGFQQLSGPGEGILTSFQQPPLGPALCDAPSMQADYQSSQGTDVTVGVGHHADLWPAPGSFWSTYWAGATAASVPAGPLGGQAECSTNSMGPNCVWFDNDTFGNFLGPSGMSQSQCASLMLIFRAAIERI